MTSKWLNHKYQQLHKHSKLVIRFHPMKEACIHSQLATTSLASLSYVKQNHWY